MTTSKVSSRRETNALVGKQLTIGDIGVGSIFVNLFHAGYGVDTKRWPKLAAYLAALARAAAVVSAR